MSLTVPGGLFQSARLLGTVVVVPLILTLLGLVRVSCRDSVFFLGRLQSDDQSVVLGDQKLFKDSILER